MVEDPVETTSRAAPQLGVLLVEDDELQREVLTEALRGQGFLVVAAATGREGLEAFEQIRLDAAIVDEHLPDMRGVEFIRRADLLPRDAFVLLTGDSGVTVPGVPVLIKPYELDRVFAAVGHAAMVGRTRRLDER